ncbi:MAG: NUDIX hydrolase [Actinobacteria bacterium]|nr:NUDIX hydrolase [Actinomycetota bacterium]
MKRWQVAGGVLENRGRVLLVENQRRGGASDWSPPGGVVDPGETLLSALSREVIEETGLTVSVWERRLYCVTVEAPDMEWTMSADIHLAGPHSGEIAIDDPDQIVTQARWVDSAESAQLMRASPLWLREPFSAWVDNPWAAGTRSFRYRVIGTDRSSYQVTRID